MAKPPIIKVNKVADLRGAAAHPRSWAVYGRSGSGKTTLASTWPKPILFLDVNDRGLESVADVPDCFFTEVSTFEQFEEIYYLLLEDKAYAKYETVVIDTITQVQDMIVQETARRLGRRTGSEAYNWGNLKQREWGQVTGVLKDWIANYRSLDRQVIFLAQERISREDEDEDSDNAIAPSAGARVSPSVASVLNANVSGIFNTYIRRRMTEKEVNGKKVRTYKAIHSMRFGLNEVYITKLRKPKGIILPDRIDDPSYEKILDYIEGDI